MLSANWSLIAWIQLIGVTSATVMVVGWAFLKFFGQRIVDHQFARSLEEFKARQLAKIEALRAEQAQTHELLRFDISASLDRTAKLHVFEFEVLPEAWRLLHLAGGSCHEVVRIFRRGVDVHALDDAALEEILSKLDTVESDKAYIRGHRGVERQGAYTRVVDGLKAQTAAKDHAEFHNYLLSHGIFIQKPLIEKFKALGGLIRDALQEDQHEREMPSAPGPARSEARTQFREQWSSQISDLEAELQSRLWDARLVSVDQRTTSS